MNNKLCNDEVYHKSFMLQDKGDMSFNYACIKYRLIFYVSVIITKKSCEVN